MRTLLIKRITNMEDGTFGVLLMENGFPWMLTCERPWKDNANSISSIPTGTYTCEIVNSPSHGKVYEIKNVPGRTSVLIHSGNTEIDTKGCLLLGRSFGVITATDPDSQHSEMQPAVLSSKDAVAEFMKIMNDEKFTLRIMEV